VDDLLRLLELVCRELEAEDAHVRLGGRRDDDPRLLEAELRPGCRLVVRFAEPPPRLEETVQRLAELAHAFTSTVLHAIDAVDAVWSRSTSARDGAHAGAGGYGQALVQTLADLRDATGAALALVVDRQSPVIWGCSDPDLGLRDRPAARVLAGALTSLRAQGLDPVHAAASQSPEAAGLRLEQAAQGLRAPKASELERAAKGGASGSASLELARRALQNAEHAQPGGAALVAAAARALLLLDESPDAPARMPEGDEPGLASKGFLGLYVVALVFTRPFSPLRVEGVLRRALPIIERHVLELPPLEPEPVEGRVVPLRP
jgi:hypothetical protein